MKTNLESFLHTKFRFVSERLAPQLAIAVLLICAPAARAASPKPAVYSITPNAGTSNGGTFVTIHGANFVSGATATVGGLALTNLTVVSSSSITGKTQAHPAGGTDVFVTNPDGQQGVLRSTLYNQGFERGSTLWTFSGSGSATVTRNAVNAHDGIYYAELSSPKAGNHPLMFIAGSNGTPKYFPVAAGDSITYGGWAYRVSGDGLARWGIEMTNSSKANPQYLSAPPANVQVPMWNVLQRTYTIPSGISYVRMYAEIVNNTAAAVARFDDAFLQVSPGGSYGYTYTSPPVVTSVSPNWGTPDGGTTRTVYGTGFSSGATVTFDGVAATNIVVNNDNAITLFVPPHSAASTSVEVTNSDGQTSTLANAYTYKTAPAPPAGLTDVHHIIFTFQENRSFDNYFGMMDQYRANNGVNDNAVDGLNLNTQLTDIGGQKISPFHLQTECQENTQPSWNASHADYDNGLMDDFLKTGNDFPSPSSIDPNGTRAIGYYDWTDLPYYYALAFQFATSDRYFSSAMAPTGVNRSYTFAATSLGFIGTPQPPSGGYFNNLTIFDLLDRAGISWRYYYQQAAPQWITIWSTYSRDSDKVVPISQYYSDLEDESTFPQVAFIEETGSKDEHPKPNPGQNDSPENIQEGASLMSNIIGSLMASPTWKTSVLILSYDEGGGLYDHVPPPNMPAPDGYAPYISKTDAAGLFNQAGFRVPLMVVSPWTIPHFVSHIPEDHTSILKFIETRFSLPPLTSRDAAADNMMEFFNFQSPAWMTPPTLPTQPTDGVCDLNLETAPNQ